MGPIFSSFDQDESMREQDSHHYHSMRPHEFWELSHSAVHKGLKTTISCSIAKFFHQTSK